MTRNTLFRVGVLFMCFSMGICGCRKASLTGTWHGTINSSDSVKGGSAEMEAVLQETPEGIQGVITWHHATGGWKRFNDASFGIQSGVVTENKVLITASSIFGSGVVDILQLKLDGDRNGAMLKGTDDVEFQSFGTIKYPSGTFELSKK